jgi:hypothetical protein
MNEFEKYIGLTMQELTELLEKNGKYPRVVNIDGVPCIVTRDYRLDRLNVKLKNGVVDSINGWG